MEKENKNEGITLVTYDQLKNGFKQPEKIEPYPIRKEDNCHTNLYCEIKYPNSHDGKPFFRLVRYVGRLRDDEIIECVLRYPTISGYVRLGRVVTVLSISYWNLDTRRSGVNIVIK